MRRFLSFLALLALVLIQFHGLTHESSTWNFDDHSCAICEISHHSAVETPDFAIFEFTAPDIFPVPKASPEFIPSAKLYTPLLPRAPPA
ncbi:MAG: hypothetical protein KDD22_08530 [Bdellovibrionales bacterium]|nr:hypothetical protein [Bdellovibrionales bacterium]